MAIIYSYPLATTLQDPDLFIISRLPEDPEEISNYSVTLNSISTYIIDKAFNGTDNYIPKFDGTASLVNSIIYQDDDGHVGIGVPGSTPNPVHKFEVYDDRSENVSSDYTQVNSTVVGPPFTGGGGGVLSRLSTDGGSTFPYGISLIPGTTASDIAASGRIAFHANSDLDTSAPSGYSGQVTFDGANPHWILGGNLTDTTTKTLHVKGDMLVDTDLEVDGGLDVAGAVRLGFTGNDPVILGNPTGKRTEWNNPGYFEIYAENPDVPGDFNETIDIDGDFLGGGYIGVYPVRTEDKHGVRMHSRDSGGLEANFIDIASVESSTVYDEDQIRLITSAGGSGTFAGIKVSHPTDNRFRFNSEFSTEPTVPFLVNDSAKFIGQVTIPLDPVADTDAASKAYVDAQNSGQVTGDGTTNTLPIWADGPNSELGDSIVSELANRVYVAGSLLVGTNNVIPGTNALTSGDGNNVLGNNSVAFGFNNEVSGNRCGGLGANNIVAGGQVWATGDGNNVGIDKLNVGGNIVTAGFNNTVKSGGSCVVGTSNILTNTTELAGINTNFAMGSSNTLNDVNDGISLGFNNTINDNASCVLGKNNTTNAVNTYAIGKSNTLSSEDDYAFGLNNTISGTADIAMALGHNNILSGSQSYAFGRNLEDGGQDNNVIIGRYNATPTATGRIVFGTGFSPTGRKNAIEIQAGTNSQSGLLFPALRSSSSYNSDSDAAAAGVERGELYRFNNQVRINLDQVVQDARNNEGFAYLTPQLKTATPGGSSTISGNYNLVLLSWTGGNGIYTLNLPSASGHTNRLIRITTDGTLSSGAGDKIDITAIGGDTIDGAASFQISKQYEGLAVFSTGSEWIIVQAKAH